MKDKFTILLIPPNSAPARQINLSAPVKRFIAGGIVLFVVAFAGVIALDIWQVNYIKKYQAEFAQTEQLKTMLQEKDNEIAHLNDESAKMTQNIGDINSLEDKISSILNLKSAPSTGSISRGATQQSFASRSMDLNANAVASHLDLFKQYYDAAVKYEDELNHTPTIMPLETPITITSPYGYRKNPFGGWSSEFHDGIDLSCQYGTPVHTTAAGTVTFAGWDPVYGWKVQIDHGNGVSTFYGHNSRLMVHAGDSVNKGDVISYSGNSGRSTGAHLHYGAYVNGKSVDPLMFTNAAKEQ